MYVSTPVTISCAQFQFAGTSIQPKCGVYTLLIIHVPVQWLTNQCGAKASAIARAIRPSTHIPPSLWWPGNRITLLYLLSGHNNCSAMMARRIKFPIFCKPEYLAVLDYNLALPSLPPPPPPPTPTPTYYCCMCRRLRECLRKAPSPSSDKDLITCASARPPRQRHVCMCSWTGHE